MQVTFQYLSRARGISSEAAQRYHGSVFLNLDRCSDLQGFVESNSDVKPLYLVAGVTKAASGSKHRVFRLVGADALEGSFS